MTTEEIIISIAVLVPAMVVLFAALYFVKNKRRIIEEARQTGKVSDDDTVLVGKFKIGFMREIFFNQTGKQFVTAVSENRIIFFVFNGGLFPMGFKNTWEFNRENVLSISIDGYSKNKINATIYLKKGEKLSMRLKPINKNESIETAIELFRSYDGRENLG